MKIPDKAWPGPTFPTNEDSSLKCPNCDGAGLKRFYSLPGVPVHSVLLMPNREAARSYARGDLDLAFCPACGFITNTQFDASLHEYSERCEETQGFSPTFSTFAEALEDTLIEQWDLSGKTVLEIGCGKGEFLAALCERGVAKGIGIDPACVPGRLQGEGASRIEFIQELYSKKHAGLQADFVCCRHTLEHIAPTRDFVALIRATLKDRPATPVFFDLPDTVRVLREGAFWDIYYEHCSYFTPGSLARLFRACRFDIQELRRDYGDQFLILAATPSDEATPPSLPQEHDLEEVEALVSAFADACAAQIKRWRDVVDECVQKGQRLVLWGSGSKGVAFLTTLGVSDEIEYVVDINPHRQGMFMPGTGHEIVAPEFLITYQPDVVVAMNPVYREEIATDLARLGVQAKCIAL